MDLKTGIIKPSHKMSHVYFSRECETSHFSDTLLSPVLRYINFVALSPTYTESVLVPKHDGVLELN